jgi:hypothetical protein
LNLPAPSSCAVASQVRACRRFHPTCHQSSFPGGFRAEQPTIHTSYSRWLSV